MTKIRISSQNSNRNFDYFNEKIILTSREPLSYQAELCFDVGGQHTGQSLKYVRRRYTRLLQNLLTKEEAELEEISNFLNKDRSSDRSSGAD